jgi:hypothetical protein
MKIMVAGVVIPKMSLLNIATILFMTTVCHGKIHHAIKNGNPSISMGHGFHGYVTNNQRLIVSFTPSPSVISIEFRGLVDWFIVFLL